MPSFLNDRCDVTDFLPVYFTRYATSQAYTDHQKKVVALTAKIREQNLGPKIWHDSFDKPNGGVSLYVSNEGLAIPYVSPMLAGSLGNLPPLLLVRTKSRDDA